MGVVDGRAGEAGLPEPLGDQRITSLKDAALSGGIWIYTVGFSFCFAVTVFMSWVFPILAHAHSIFTLTQ